MRRIVIICSLVVAAIVLATGCRQIDPAPATGDLLLSISAGEMGTKAPTDDQKEGKEFQKLLVIITDDQNKFLQGKYVPMTSPADILENIEFTGLPTGKTYKVFAFANIDHATWSPGFNLEQIENQDFSSILEGEDKLLKVNQLLTLSSGDVPNYPSESGMLLTGWQEVFVGVNKNLGTITLRRPVLRLNVLVRNRTGKEITLTNLHFSEFNTTKAFLLDHWTTEGVPVVPGTPSYTALYPIHTSGSDPTEPIIIPASPTEEDELVYSTLLFENAATAERYKMFATLKLKRDNGTYTTDYSLQETEGGSATPGCVLKLLDKETRQASEITYMCRNQDLTVVLNVYYEEILDKFTFSVESWTTGVGGSHAFD